MQECAIGLGSCSFRKTSREKWKDWEVSLKELAPRKRQVFVILLLCLECSLGKMRHK